MLLMMLLLMLMLMLLLMLMLMMLMLIMSPMLRQLHPLHKAPYKMHTPQSKEVTAKVWQPQLSAHVVRLMMLLLLMQMLH
jgi:hypothetical protein